MPRSRVVLILHNNCRLLGFGVTLKIGAYQLVVPGPVVFRICCSMYANETTATPDVLLERCLLFIVEHVAGGAKKYDCFKTGKVLRVEYAGVVGGFYGNGVVTCNFFESLYTSRY